MHESLLIGQLKSQWIIQSINYSLLPHAKYNNLFLDQAKWLYVHDYRLYLDQIKQYIETEEKLEDCSINLYYVNFSNKKTYLSHYVIFLSQGSALKLLIKFDHNFDLLGQFRVERDSKNHLVIVLQNSDISIVEKIHFLNSNLRVVKSTFYADNNYIGTSFSSEIRIS